MDRQPLPWTRRVVSLGQPPALDRDGWPVTSRYAGSSAGQPLAVLRNVPLLVVRAEWGMGKSVAFEQEHAELRSADISASFLDVGRCGTSASRAAAKLSEQFQPPIGPGEWHVFLDGLDEGIECLRDLPDLIIEQVRGLEEEAHRSLRLRISCRTARWPARFETDLRRLWPGEDQVNVVTLMPLSREDVSLAAHQMAAPDAAAFPGLVERQGLVPLATHPMTLLQLLEDYRDKRSLPASAHEAYRQGCLWLCREIRRPAGLEQLRTQAAPEHLLAVAARVAAVLQFGAWSVVSDADAHGGELADDAVALSRLTTGTEPGHLGHEVQCTMAELRQLTESSLLVPVGDYRWEFAHKSYQEFLAAEFLHAHGLRPAAQRGLLWIGDGPGRHVTIRHQEVAAWRSRSDPTVFADLLEDDPAVAVLSRDLPTRAGADRARVIDALLSLLQRDDTAQLDHTVLHRLDHPHLAGQLRPYLTGGQDNSWLVYWAANIARSCPDPELSSDLLAVAEDLAHNPEVRVAAVRGVTAPDERSVERLRRLAEDESAEVVAAALQQLRPNHLPLAEFLGLFREPEPTYVGAAWALRREIPGQITPAEITEATRWAHGVLSSGDQGSPSLAISILARAITLTAESPESDELVHLVADALLGSASEDRAFLLGSEVRGPRDDLNDALSAQETVRRQVVLRLLRSGSVEQSSALIASLSLILSDDLVFWMEHWHELPAVGPRITGQLVRFPRPDDPAVRSRCDAARAAQPTLRKATEFWDAPRAEPVWEREDRERADTERQRNTYCQADLHAALDAMPAAGTDLVRAQWHRVIWQMARTVDGSAYQPTGSLLTLAADAPSRPAASTELGRKLEQAARHVLSEAPVLHASDLAPHSVVAPFQAPELTAFALIDSLTGITNDVARWAGWAVALASTISHDEALEVRRRFLPQCTQQAAAALAPLLTAVLDTVSEETARTIAGSYADQTYDDHARTVLRDWACGTDRTPEQWHAVLGVLALCGDDKALHAVADALKEDPGTLDPDSPARQRWFLAVQTLVQSERFLHFWPDIRPRLRTPMTFEGFIEQIVRMPLLVGRWPAPMGRLPEQDLADLYRLLIEHLGIEKAANPPLRSGFLTDDDRIGEMVRSLPNIIAYSATPEAATVLRALAEQYPRVPQLRLQARTTARAAAARAAAPLDPEALVRLVTQAHMRVVHDKRQLLDLVIEALQTMQGELHGYNGTVVNLWNRDKAKFDSDTQCWPAWEDDLCDTVASFLRREIGENRTVINREVEVRRTGLPGLRTDIHIDIPADGSHENLRVVIECKGCWNKELPTALEKQLTAYLTEPRTAGLLLVGYFDCERWNHKKRGCPTHNHDIEQVRKSQLNAAARAQDQASVTVSSYVLDCRLPGTDSAWRNPSPLAP